MTSCEREVTTRRFKQNVVVVVVCMNRQWTPLVAGADPSAMNLQVSVRPNGGVVPVAFV